MAITLNGGTGVITGVAVGGLPDGIVDADMMASGVVTGVKQIIHGPLKTTPTISSSTLTATGLTASITPSATTSKIQIHVHLPISTESNESTSFVRLQLYRDSTAIGEVGTGATGNQINTQWHISQLASNSSYEEYYNFQNFTGFFVDSPSSTSALAYSVKWAIAASSSGDALLNRVWANDNGNYIFYGASNIMLTEVDNG